ncbi:MAG: hypothetical protein ACRC0F_07935 [Cetobacterium sp.]
MLVRDFLEVAFPTKNKKTGDFSHHAYTLIKKHGLSIDEEVDVKKLIVIASSFGNSKATKEKTINFLLNSFSCTIESGESASPTILREKGYKECCKIFHPDNNITGDEEMFKFIQIIKEAFWDEDYNPRPKIKHLKWMNKTERSDFNKKWGFPQK